MDHLDFSEEEIEQQLAALGYNNIPKQRLREFKQDLDQLIRHEKSKSHSSTEWTSPSDSKRSSNSPPALGREKVHLSNIGPSRNYVHFNTSSVGQHRDIFTSTFNEDDIGGSDMNHYYDSYSQHSIAHRPARPSTAPNRLRTEERPSESFCSDASQATSPDRGNLSQSKPVIKRKVLRKHHGKSHVCDESSHSEDSALAQKLSSFSSRMYKAFDRRLENENEDDEGSQSSFWTDQESEEEDREYVKKENRKIVTEPDRDSDNEKAPCVMEGGSKEKTLERSRLEKDKYGQAETNPNADEYDNEDERRFFINKYEKDKSIEISKTEKGKEREKEEGKESKGESEQEKKGEESEDEKEVESEEEETENEEKELESEAVEGKESEEDEKGEASEEEEESEEVEGKGTEEEEEESEEEVEGKESEEEEEESEEEVEGKEIEEEEEESEEEVEGKESEEEEEESEEEVEGKESEEEDESEEESEEKEREEKEVESEEMEVEGKESKEESEEEVEKEKEEEESEEVEVKESEEEEEESEEEVEEKESSKVEDVKEKEKEKERIKLSEKEGQKSEEEEMSENNSEGSECSFSGKDNTQSDVSECVGDQGNVNEQRGFLEHSNSEEKCTDLLSEWSGEETDGEKKRERAGSRDENFDFSDQEHKDKEGDENKEGDNISCMSDKNEGIVELLGDIERKQSSVKENRAEEDSENPTQSCESKPNSDEELNKEELKTDKEEESECFLGKKMGKSEESEEDRSRGDKTSDEDKWECFVNDDDNKIHPGQMEGKNEEGEYCFSEEELMEMSRGVEEQKEVSSEEEEERQKFFEEAYPFESAEKNQVSLGIMDEKESYYQRQKSWASYDEGVTVANDHSQQQTENYTTDSTWEPEHGYEDKEKQQRETRDAYAEREIFKDFHESLGSPAASILTSGYGTYKPGSSKDGDPEEVDYRDDCTLAGLEEENHAQDYEDVCSPVWSTDNPSSETPDRTSKVPAESLERSADIQTSHHEESESPDCQTNQSPAEYDGISTQDQNIDTKAVACFNEGLEVAALRANFDHPFNIRHRRSRGERRSEEKQYEDGHDQEKKVTAYSSGFGAVSELEEHLNHMQIGAPRVQYDSESEEAGNYSDRSSSATDEPSSAFQEYVKGMTRSHSESDIRPRSKSFIRPVFDHPHTRNWKKTDPVAKYLQYKQEWEMFKPPGEKSRKELHWAIREQLLYQPPPPRPQKTYIPNTYVVPTEKKRSALRWEVRNNLAHGIIPTKITYP